MWSHLEAEQYIVHDGIRKEASDNIDMSVSDMHGSEEEGGDWLCTSWWNCKKYDGIICEHYSLVLSID